MRNLFILCVIVLYNTFIFAQNPREDILFNFDWKFIQDDNESFSNSDFDDTNWQQLNIPHDMQINMPWDESAKASRAFKQNTVGWYCKTFKANPDWKNKQVLLDFDGIAIHGDVWVNGKKVGEADYGYLGFEVNISELLNYEGDNVVAVRADCNTTGSRWYTGAGLYRDVHLLVRNKISVARHGMFVTTPEITGNHAKVGVQVEVQGFHGYEDVMIKADIFNPQGEKVGSSEMLAFKKTRKHTQENQLPEIKVNNPQLWSCETPNLYTAEVSLILDGKVLDKVSDRFGIRTLEFSPDFGFKLNGKKLFLKGTNLHHDLGAVGAAAFETSMARQFDVLKQFGFNHIRAAHNPYSEAFYDLADEKGFLIVDELYDKWSNKDYWIGRKPWTDSWYHHMTEWIKRDRNHPSVILWSFGNEFQMREDLAGYPTSDWGVTSYKILDVLAKRYDPTRKSTVGLYPSRANALKRRDKGFDDEENIVPPELASVTEITSFNYQSHNYEQYLNHEPDMIVYQSEATSNQLLVPYYDMNYEKMVGLAYWGSIEYWGESNGWPKKGWNYSFFDHTLNPLPEAYLIKSAFSEQPVVQIAVLEEGEGEQEIWNDIAVGKKVTSSHWNREAGKNYNVFTYTNAEEVELLVNGESIGVQKNPSDKANRNIITWKAVPYQAGEIVAIARTNGKEITRHSLETTGKAVALQFEIEDYGAWQANSMDLQYVKVYAVDKKGRKVPNVTGEVTFEVSGAATLLAVDNGDHYSNELFNTNKRKLHNGFALAILRANQEAGKVTLKASVNGLKSDKVTLKTQ
ncbi:glycoside hydrolase family 2 TIM barrel-domain containing protein [Formosa sp. A9]|uniref:glycoside hydrolase family 2 TIM barrel-domain containing protein n=1 Tax=Formosa sp. A9 TaxID=3442641 RepID=UPI003EBB7248